MKIINKVEHINKIFETKKKYIQSKSKNIEEKTEKNKKDKKDKRKVKVKKVLRTLWVRRRKKIKSAPRMAS